MLRVIVFEQNDTSWNEMDCFYVNMPPDAAIGSVRRDLAALMDRLAGCRIAAGSTFSGVLYRELDSRGFSIFEVSDFTPGTLDGILRDLEDADAADGAAETPARPVETETPGVYRLDLIRLQEVHPEVTSKRALLEFLETTPFYELRLACTHVPPWIENGPYEIVSGQEGETIVATVRKKQC
ncbi:Iron only nitrogenase protein AnfO (AnfO_nitrog) [Sporobacter termitidis DSM 10068]|uniref:Iron only nitrogenase protein AnfO (AnfO_nitrog) n=2 Tax=Sporobacter TaxID=44748 RepID=A0A1M5XIF5_9FIRM|nr:Iron only nitrogenase protein AnfO (AnfO_nitrog) [Sporobacter termitidis DSM 10068]